MKTIVSKILEIWYYIVKIIEKASCVFCLLGLPSFRPHFRTLDT